MKVKHLIPLILMSSALLMEDTTYDGTCMNSMKTMSKKITLMVVVDGGTVGVCCGGGQRE